MHNTGYIKELGGITNFVTLKPPTLYVKNARIREQVVTIVCPHFATASVRGRNELKINALVRFLMKEFKRL